jgi:hypothetical protein
MNKTQIFETIKYLLLKIEDIEFAYIFGSYATCTENPLSDIDIAIYQRTNKSAYDYRMFEFSIESDLIQSIPSYKFDVRSLNDAPIIVIGKILNEGILLFMKDDKFYYDYLVNNRIKYMDYCIIYDPLFKERYENLINDR